MERINQHKRDFPKVMINVGGVRHEVMWRVLEVRPLTRLGMLGEKLVAGTALEQGVIQLNSEAVSVLLFTPISTDLFLKQRLKPMRI